MTLMTLRGHPLDYRDKPEVDWNELKHSGRYAAYLITKPKQLLTASQFISLASRLPHQRRAGTGRYR